MKLVFAVCLIVVGTSYALVAQDSLQPVMQRGIHVQMPVSNQAAEIPAADGENATVVTLTAEGRLFLGVQPVEVDVLANLGRSKVYVKVDARASYQQVLTAISALHGHPLVLLTAPTVMAGPGKITPPYGVRLTLLAR